MKRPPKLTRRDKIEMSRKQRVEEREALKRKVASLEDRVAALEPEPAAPQPPRDHRARKYFGKPKGDQRRLSDDLNEIGERNCLGRVDE